MNRIILLGNGFDLAHGLPTKYSDFIFNYLSHALSDYKYNDDYFSFSTKWNFPKLKTAESINDLNAALREYRENYTIKYKNELLGTIISEFKGNNWVDLENLYYSNLKEIITHGDKIVYDPQVEKYNKEFESIKKLLELYLVKYVKNGYKYFAHANFTDLFSQDILQKDFSITNLVENTKPIETLFLNFNYTDTIKPYLKNRSNSRLINIHGELQNSENPIVFGFGDELDSKYAEIESLNENELFNHIKSFMYMQSSNYHDLTRFVESMEFQVFILGHSCGLSDRTMLNYIFEHKNCKSIKIFYHATKNSFINTTHEISRHFKDKSAMRMKIVPFDKSEPCPQVQLEKIAQ